MSIDPFDPKPIQGEPEGQAVAQAAQPARLVRPWSVGAAVSFRAGLERLITGEPARNATRLAVRFLGARTLSLVTLAVAAWFFQVSSFAEFGVYLALLNLAWVAVFLRYESAVIAAKRELEAASALRVCVVVGAGVWALVTACAVAVHALGGVGAKLAPLIPLALAARAVLRIAVMSATRGGDFRGLGRVALVQAVLQPLVLLGLARVQPDGAICLAVADVAGHGVAALYLALRQRRALAEALGGRWSARGLALTARAWSGLPLFNLPGSMMALGFVAAPVLITPLVADPDLAGHVALAMRLFDVPTQIIGSAATPILLNRLRPSRERPSAVFGRRMMAGLGAAVAGLYGAAALGLMLVDPLLDGTVFADLGEVAAVVALFQAFVAMAGPLAEGCGLYREQGPLTAIHAAALAAAVAVLPLATVLGPLAGLWALALVAAGRALAVGERLRVLSIRGRLAADAGRP